MENSKSAIPQGRQHVAQLIARAGDVIQIDDAVSILGIDRDAAAKTLARWTKQGWLRRVRRGVYVPATLDSLGSEHVLEDPWVLVPSLFAPAYVGGRTAAEYWDLTEQLFNDIVVITAKSVRQKSQKRHGATFTLKHVQARKLFGTKSVWRGSAKVQVSDVQKTLVDMLDDPSIGGGIQHVADCLGEYFKRKDRNDNLLIDYCVRLGNGAVFKRLGYLSEIRGGEEELAQACRGHLSKGTAKLDPSLDCQKLVTQWQLWVPARWKKARVR
ncbi:MAG: type IV toxin-antitoxin system AbiEi family antitoxin domain-containing protein [Rhodobacterales bacterium]|nr:type IV toxin-antitoxin system AbiEi family antitoxin domain-containing protein [Rhodobacterales bacterium]